MHDPDDTASPPIRPRWVPMLIGFLAGSIASGFALSAAGASPEHVGAGLLATACGIAGAALGALWHRRNG